ncbi:MAG: hypothetical protein WD049_07360 [Candidatus Paceibacterota bacterium]
MADLPGRSPESDLAVITCYFNPCGYASRKQNFLRFAEGLTRQGIDFWTIEAVLPGQQPLTAAGHRVAHVVFPEADWLWQKERLLNLLIRRLPPQFTKVAWVDCDLIFNNDNWLRIASESLDTWPVIQLFDFVHYVGPDGTPMIWGGVTDHRASLASIATHFPERAPNFRIGAPGLAWAARRSLLDAHGLYEKEIAGGGDAVFAAALYGWYDHRNITSGTVGMARSAQAYIASVYRDVQSFVGYIPCSIRPRDRSRPSDSKA